MTSDPRPAAPGSNRAPNNGDANGATTASAPAEQTTTPDPTSKKKATEKARAVERIKPIRAWIKANCHRSDLTKKDIAAAAGISPDHLCTIFRAAGEVPPLQLLRNIRLDRARELLESSPTRPRLVTEVARAVGYTSRETFTDNYRRRFGYTPTRTPRVQRQREPSPSHQNGKPGRKAIEQKILIWIKVNLSRPVTVKEMAAAVGITVSELRECCKKEWNLAPMEVVEAARLDAARQLLRDGKETPGALERVTNMVGYRTGRFSGDYQRRFGETPDQTLRAVLPPRRLDPGWGRIAGDAYRQVSHSGLVAPLSLELIDRQTSRIRADPELQHQFGVTASVDLLRRQFVSRTPNGGYLIQVSFLRWQIVTPGLVCDPLIASDGTDTPSKIVDPHHPPTSIEKTVRVRPVTHVEAALLQVERHLPALTLTRRILSGRTCLEVSDLVFVDTKTVVDYTVQLTTNDAVPELYTPREAAFILGVRKTASLREFVKEGKLTAIRTPETSGHFRYRSAEVHALSDAIRTQSADASKAPDQ